MLETGGTGNILFTFAEKRDPKVALETIRKYDNFNIIIDSGAFSVWNSGKTMDRDELLAYYKHLYAYRQDLTFVNLDVIPGVRGRKPTKAEAEIACQQGLENYYWFRKNGIETMPVFHEGDDFKYLEIFKKETDYIAISPANDSSVKRRIVWLDQVYRNLKGDYKTHGLAATSIQLLKRYPFYSVDSINWKTPVIYGRSSVNKNEYLGRLARVHKEMVLKKEVQFYVDQQAAMTHLWKTRGIEWKD